MTHPAITPLQCLTVMATAKLTRIRTAFATSLKTEYALRTAPELAGKERIGMPTSVSALQLLTTVRLTGMEMAMCSSKTYSTSWSIMEHIAILSEDPSLKKKNSNCERAPIGRSFSFPLLQGRRCRRKTLYAHLTWAVSSLFTERNLNSSRSVAIFASYCGLRTNKTTGLSCLIGPIG